MLGTIPQHPSPPDIVNLLLASGMHLPYNPEPPAGFRGRSLRCPGQCLLSLPYTPKS